MITLGITRVTWVNQIEWLIAEIIEEKDRERQAAARGNLPPHDLETRERLLRSTASQDRSAG